MRLLISAAQCDAVNGGGSCGVLSWIHAAPCSPGPHWFSSPVYVHRCARSLPDLSGRGGDGVWNPNLFSCRHQLSFCVKASGPSRHYLGGKGKIDVLPPRFSEV